MIFLVAMAAFPPLSTDMYLPALPIIAKDFGASEGAVNVTLIAFFLAFGVATLAWGPLSDKYGRKPMLTIGTLCYALGSVCCAFSYGVLTLTLARILQAAGGAAGNAMAAAIIRDCFRGRRQERVLSILQSMVMVCPVVAPMIGSLVMRVLSWQGVFYMQGAMGLVVFAGALLMKETIVERNDLGVLRSVSRLGAVLTYRRFADMLVISCIPQVPLMTYIVASTFVYQNFFGMDSVSYSLFFAVAAFGTISGPLAYSAFGRFMARGAFLGICFAGMLVGGVAICFIGHLSPWAFAISMYFMGLFCTGSKVPTAYMLLNYKKGDIGSTSSLIGSGGFLTGSLGMVVASIPFDLIKVSGATYAVCAALSGLLLIILFKRHPGEFR
ncbi:MAG: MFS transporter [Clostridiales Family XIII bacterium]|nr:MFS transporter [Clostridiales Family XIII bacterium]